MTAPAKALAFPVVDHEAIRQAIKTQRTNVDLADVKTRSQMMLEESIRREQELGELGNWMREQIVSVKKNIADLQTLLTEMEAVERDNAVELSVVLQSINLLKQAGVS